MRKFFRTPIELGPWNDQNSVKYQTQEIDYLPALPSSNEVSPSAVATVSNQKLPGFHVETEKLVYQDTYERLFNSVKVYAGPIQELFNAVTGIIIQFEAHLVIENRTYPGTANAAFGTEDTYVDEGWLVDFGNCMTASALYNREFRPSPKGCLFLATVHGLSKVLTNFEDTFFKLSFTLGVNGNDKDDYRTKPRDDEIYLAIDFKLQLTKIHEFVLGQALALSSSDNEDDTTQSESEDDFHLIGLSDIESVC